MGETLVIIVRTLTCPDGVVGLNGWQYLLHPDNTLMEFKNGKEAKEFLLQHEIDLEDVELCSKDDSDLLK